MLSQTLFLVLVMLLLLAVGLLAWALRSEKLRHSENPDEGRRRQVMQEDLGDRVLWTRGDEAPGLFPWSLAPASASGAAALSMFHAAAHADGGKGSSQQFHCDNPSVQANPAKRERTDDDHTDQHEDSHTDAHTDQHTDSPARSSHNDYWSTHIDNPPTVEAPSIHVDEHTDTPHEDAHCDGSHYDQHDNVHWDMN